MTRIEKGVPIPVTYSRRYPFRHMQVGDSFFVEWKHNAVSAAAASFAKRHPGYKFTTRKVRENGVSGTRCWRVPVAPLLTIVRSA